ncbi:MAG: sigma-70 family RNA polymerase sigma factor [Sedimentisphaerales bacterium]|nr:sigma-70 family RNA polymerase sigma factor [Sedimentisphaerales bacterium]
MNQQNSPSGATPEEANQEFLRQLLQYQRRIFTFILTLIPRRSDAEDIFQKTLIVMVQKYKYFEPGSNFNAWALKIARLEVLHHRAQHRTSKVLFDSTLFENVLQCAEARFPEMDLRTKALSQCMEKLSERDQRLIYLRYNQSRSIKDVARLVSRPIQGMYKVMARIHQSLRECIDRTMAKEEWA